MCCGINRKTREQENGCCIPIKCELSSTSSEAGVLYGTNERGGVGKKAQPSVH
ncbi:hypothetical protein [Candidatus Ichthyocystis sparus]|uniref:hypothetical protein n=1 Tax=Candidatus Ichthyocystis sparus TaxID=1561004 RepID=UPI00159ED648|nr:hypothetical protein [Candidatus Ichthyocystis sparus]